MRAFPRYLLLLLIIVPGVGCAMVEPASRKSYETVSGMPQRDSARARELNVEALDLLECGKLSQAHQAVDEALIADIDHAPAHNTLGKIYYRKGNYYLAAWEFEFAIRLYPDFPEYHNNLGLVYEAAGKLPEAIKEFEIAANLSPDRFNFVSNLARARMRTEEETPGTRALLEQVVYMDPRPEWKDWARLHLNTTHLDIPSEISTVGHVQLEEGWGSNAAASSPATSGAEAAADNSQIILPPPVENGDWQILNPLPR